MESGTVLTKKRIENSPHHIFGDLYINDKVFTVKKSIYDAYQIGDVVAFSYTNHVSFSGVHFHNLSHIEKINHETLISNSSVKTTLATQDEIKFYDSQTSKFFFWINVGFVSFVFFFVEMYFIARFEFDVLLQQFLGKTYFLVFIFLIFYTSNFLFVTQLFKRRKFQKLKSLEKTTFQILAVEFIQEQDTSNCNLTYIDKGQSHNLSITMDVFHKIKKHPLLEISFLNHTCFFQLKPVLNERVNS